MYRSVIPVLLVVLAAIIVIVSTIAIDVIIVIVIAVIIIIIIITKTCLICDAIIVNTYQLALSLVGRQEKETLFFCDGH